METTTLNKSYSGMVGTYIDLFSGCGGLSLGLGKAGWTGIFAIEKDQMAFETFRHNMIDGSRYSHFTWPKWLPKESTTIETLLSQHYEKLEKLKYKVDLIAGGPPCQGFSLAGMRKSDDPRNRMSQEYIKMVGIIRPKFLLLENVKGFDAAFNNSNKEAKKTAYSLIVQKSLEDLGYKVYREILNSDRFGVPQVRSRFIMLGIRNDLKHDGISPFILLEDIRKKFLEEKRLPINRPITVKNAIGDLEISKHKLVHHSGNIQSGFKKIKYKPPKKPNRFQKLMREGLNGRPPNSMRLARHKASTIEKFRLIKKISRPGIVLNAKEKAIIGTRKHAICVLDPTKPSKTVTTLPDDILHYSEPRILTVRETARIQSFPDDFVFTGKYTTGGKIRTSECPRYTQVGNAVPPLLGEALGKLILFLLVKTMH